MYCSECGSKNKKDAIYCEECGTKIIKNRFKKKLSKKTKYFIGIITGMILILGFLITILLLITSPKTVAKQYMEMLTKKDSQKMYEYLNLDGDKTFVTKEIYQEVVKERVGNIQNYHIADIEYGSEKLTATVTIAYIVENSNIEKTMRLPLVKQKKKKWLFFDHWKIVHTDSKEGIIENYKIIVPKNSNVTYAGVKVTDTYLDQKNSNTSDIYILKQVFLAPTKIKVELENGYLIEDEITPSNFKKSYTAKVSLSTISKEEQEKIITSIKDDLTTLYVGAIHQKAFSDLKFPTDQTDTIETKYNEFMKSLKEAYHKLTTIEFTSITLLSVKLNESGNLEFRFKANYHYQIRYLDFDGKEQTKESKSYSYMNVSYQVKDGTYYIVDANDLEDYFSRN